MTRLYNTTVQLRVIHIEDLLKRGHKLKGNYFKGKSHEEPEKIPVGKLSYKKKARKK